VVQAVVERVVTGGEVGVVGEASRHQVGGATAKWAELPPSLAVCTQGAYGLIR
jgi:hypothetical protein